MPAKTGFGFYEKNAQRHYPLDAQAAAVADKNLDFPTEFVVDVSLRYAWPNRYRASISSFANTETGVSVTFSAVDPARSPLASLTLPKPVVPYRNYALNSEGGDAVGWVTFGPGVVEGPYGHWRFATLEDGLLSARCARPTPNIGLDQLLAYGRTQGLTGLIELVSRSDGLLKLEQTTLNIGGANRNALVIGLDEQRGGRELFERLLGPCDGTPESGTCVRPDIRSINSVRPDCNGEIRIVFEEEIDPEIGEVLTLNANGNTVQVDTAFGVVDVCDRESIEPLIDQVDLCDTYPTDLSNT